MAWEWSHTQRAYDEAQDNTNGLPVRILREIYAEWKTKYHVSSLGEDEICPGGWHDPTYDKALREARSLSAEALADYVWSMAKKQRTCDNGGHLAWLCPYGCRAHCIPFDRDQRLILTAHRRGRQVYFY